MESTTTPKFNVTVRLTGEDGNAFNILGLVRKGLKGAGATQQELDTFYSEATSGDYDNLLRVCCRWVNVI